MSSSSSSSISSSSSYYNRQPYLDKIATSIHLPKQEGQKGYCSKTLIPDLSCSGIRSELERVDKPISTPDGRLTTGYKVRAFLKLQGIQRGLNIVNSQEKLFKIDHLQYIDTLLSSIEQEKIDKHRRRMRHFNRDKNNLGFANSFDYHSNNNNNEKDNGKIQSSDIESSETEYGSIVEPNSIVDDYHYNDITNNNNNSNNSGRSDDGNNSNKINVAAVNNRRSVKGSIKIDDSNNSNHHNDNNYIYNNNHNNNDNTIDRKSKNPTPISSSDIISTNNNNIANFDKNNHKSSKLKLGENKTMKTYSAMSMFNTLLKTSTSPTRNFGSINASNEKSKAFTK